MKTTKALRPLTVLVTAGSVALASAVLPATTFADEATPTSQSALAKEFAQPAGDEAPAVELSEAEMIEALRAIENIPDSVLAQGDEATQAWMTNELGTSQIQGFSVVGCASAIGLALVANLPAFKIAKIRSVIKTAGGTTKFVKAFKASYDLARKKGLAFKPAVEQAVKDAAKGAGPEMQQALLDLFSLGAVYNACFE